MEISHHFQDTTMLTSFKGSFLFTDHQDFKSFLDLLTKKPIKAVIVDLRHLEMIDSAGLGLFLLLRDETNKKNIILTLTRPTGQVRKMFQISRFYDLFDISNKEYDRGANI